MKGQEGAQHCGWKWTSTKACRRVISDHQDEGKLPKTYTTGHTEGLEIRLALHFSVATLEARNQWGKYIKILKEKDFRPAYSQSSVNYHKNSFRYVRSHKFASQAPFIQSS